MNSDFTIETQRLRFRYWRESDAEVLYKYASDPDVGPRAGWPPHQSVEESNIGIADTDVEVGYWIAKPYWNLGLCTEALRAMIDYCFNTKGFLTLWADHFVDNPVSGRVMEKCGFRDTGDVNWLSNLYRGDDRPVKVMRLDYGL